MCEVGDIIVIQDYKHNNQRLNRHSFVVLNDETGQIQGLDYNIICNVMSSFKNKKQRKRKLRYPGNFPITHDDCDMAGGNDNDGYIKAEQFYYFDKDEIDYYVIGSMKEDVFNLLIEFIQDLDVEFEHIVDNL